MAVVLISIFTIAYFAGYFAGAGVNRIVRRELLPGRVWGAAVVLAACLFYLSITIEALGNANGLERLSNFDRSRVRSGAIADVVLPAVVVLVAVGIAGWRQRRKSKSAPNKLLNADAQKARAG